MVVKSGGNGRQINCWLLPMQSGLRLDDEHGAIDKEPESVL